MKTGMGRFTKGCLVTALAAFIIGCLLLGVGALLGGFRLLETTDIEGVTGIPFRIHRYDNGGFDVGFMNYGWNADWDDFDDDFDNDWFHGAKWNKVGNNAGEIQLDLTADTLRKLYIELGACDLHIMPSEEEAVSLKVSGDAKHFRYLVENGDTLRLLNRTGSGIWHWTDHKVTVNRKVYLYLPENAMPDYMEIAIGAGNMESGSLQARETCLEVGAGNCKIDSLTVTGSMDLEVGAGNVTLGALEAGKLDIDVGAGELYIGSALVERETEMNLGMGNAELGGIFRGNMSVECGMGNVTLTLQDAETDHNYEIDCAMGNVRVGSRSYTGLADEVSISNGSRSTYEIECSMGDVKLYFAQ